MIKEAIVKIVSKEDLAYDEAYQVMNEIMGGETTPTQNAAFLAALSTKSAKAETIDEISGCAAAMREHAIPVETGLDTFERWQSTATGQPPAAAAPPTVWKLWASISSRIRRPASGCWRRWAPALCSLRSTTAP